MKLLKNRHCEPRRREAIPPSRLDKTIISLISRDMPLTKEPFKDLSAHLGIDERLLLERMRAFKKRGLMRKFSAVLNHRKIGFLHNAMVVWNVPQKFIDEAGNIISSFDEVSHCYERRTVPGWKYNIYSMVHGKTRRECLNAVNVISRKITCGDYRVLFSSREYKKSGARY